MTLLNHEEGGQILRNVGFETILWGKNISNKYYLLEVVSCLFTEFLFIQSWYIYIYVIRDFSGISAWVWEFYSTFRLSFWSHFQERLQRTSSLIFLYLFLLLLVFIYLASSLSVFPRRPYQLKPSRSELTPTEKSNPTKYNITKPICNYLNRTFLLKRIIRTELLISLLS